jgi:tetratricopeptide (TPR) repeat protein
LLAVTLVAGVAGVLWQARVADTERRKAEARSADLRQLSNSLLSELDDAIKQLPGSTGVQKLLVTRVLEHLDRMAKDVQGDRQTQLDLVDAYTRLGNIQGNPYDQNLGDPAGGLTSMDKAIALAKPLAPQGSTDREALRDLALAQECRSEILFGAARTPEAIASMRAAVETYDRVIAFPNVTPALIGDAAAAYGTLGDELGQSGTSSLADSDAALVAYRKTIELDYRALGIDPGFLRARRGLSILQMKIGSVEMETDPAQALRDFQIALQRADTLPKEDQSTYTTMRMRSMVQRKEADAMSELGEYSQANALFKQVAEAQERLAATDPEDLRARADLEVVLNDEAMAFADAADPVLASAPNDRARNLAAAADLFAKVVDITGKMLLQDPSNENWRSVLADAQVHLGTTQAELHHAGDSASIAGKGIATMRELAKKDDASPMILDQAAGELISVQPASLRDPRFAVGCAVRAVAISHGQRPSELLTLAQAYRTFGQIDKSRAMAKQGLALLPPMQPGSTKPRIRKLLEKEAGS